MHLCRIAIPCRQIFLFTYVLYVLDSCHARLIIHCTPNKDYSGIATKWHSTPGCVVVDQSPHIPYVKNHELLKAEPSTTSIHQRKRAQPSITTSASPITLTNPLSKPPTYDFTLHSIRAIPPNSQTAIRVLNHLLDLIYDFLSQFYISHTFPTDTDLTIRIGSVVLDFDCVARYISAVSVKIVVRRLGQLVQRGLTGLVSGDVVDVAGGVRIGFALWVV